MAGSLDGIQVVDLTRVLAGPFATMRLADMGARVVKIEIPGQGDDTRLFGPPFVGAESAYFMSINRNKRSLTLNLRSRKGKEVLLKLIETSDVIIENFRPGVLDRLGFGYDQIHEINPRMVYCAISGYGHTGPRSTDPSYDVIIQAESGLMDITGSTDGPPTKVGISLVDVAGGLAAVEGVLLALLYRGKSGKGQKVDISLMDSIISLFTYQAQSYFATAQSPERKGNLHPTLTPYESFTTKDAHLIVAVANESQWRSFLQALQPAAQERGGLLEGQLDDERFSTNPSRVEHRQELRSLLDPVFASRTTDQWIEVLSASGVPCGRINRVSEILESGLLQAREMVQEVDHSRAGPTRMLGIPIKLSESPGEVRLPPPLLGEHTEEVLTGLGYTLEDIQHLRTEGVI